MGRPIAAERLAQVGRRPKKAFKNGKTRGESGGDWCRERALWGILAAGTYFEVTGNFSKGGLASKACTNFGVMHEWLQQVGKLLFASYVISKS